MRVGCLMAQLEVHHGRVAALLAALRPLLAGPEAGDPMALAALRWRLLRTLRAYQLFKHVELFDPLIAAGPGIRAAAAGEMKRRCLALAAVFQDHVRRWSAAGPAGAWAGYAAETLALAARLEAHLADERRGAAALLRGLPSPRSPAAGIAVRQRSAAPAARRIPPVTAHGGRSASGQPSATASSSAMLARS